MLFVQIRGRVKTLSFFLSLTYEVMYMKDTLEQLKQLNSILDKLENPVVVESKKLKKNP